MGATKPNDIGSIQERRNSPNIIISSIVLEDFSPKERVCSGVLHYHHGRRVLRIENAFESRLLITDRLVGPDTLLDYILFYCASVEGINTSHNVQCRMMSSPKCVKSMRPATGWMPLPP